MKRLTFLILLVPIALFGARYGIGFILGSPTGISGKSYLTSKSAFAIHAGWSFLGNVGLHITGDYQFLFPGVIKDEEGAALESVVPYLGLGGRFRFKKNDQTDETDFHIGMRIGGGIEYLIDRFGIFLELFPVVDFLPETGFDLEGGLGLRFYF